jgi:hypothetical protein
VKTKNWEVDINKNYIFLEIQVYYDEEINKELAEKKNVFGEFQRENSSKLIDENLAKYLQ